MGTKVQAPPPRDYGKETRDTLQAQIDLAPNLYAAEAEYQPRYAALNLQTLEQALRGTGDQRGLLAQYEQDIYPTLSRIEADTLSRQRAADIAAVQQYGTTAVDALRTATGNAPLMAEMNRQALEELQAGQSLTPGELRAAQQSSRAAFAARGLGQGNQSVADEVLRSYQLGSERQAQRRAYASGVTGLNQTTGGDPFMSILGRPSQTFAAGQSFGGQAMGYGQSAGPRMFNPESAYAGNLFNSNYQGELAARTATAANRSAMLGGAMSMFGSIGGAAFGKGGMFGKGGASG